MNKYLDYTGLSEMVTKTKQLVATKQELLISGTNIKTINGSSLLGSGDISISSGGSDDIDSALSTTSENAVQNKVITKAINTAQYTADGAVAKNTEQDSSIEAIINKFDNYLKINDLLNKVYPVGAIYMSTNNVSPASFLGGTWEQIKDKFLVGSGVTFPAGSSGGSATHKLTINEMPSHTHKVLSNNYGDANANGFGKGSGVRGVSGVWTNGSDTRKYYLKDNNDNGQQIIENTGGNEQFSITPPYLAVYMWKRTA